MDFDVLTILPPTSCACGITKGALGTTGDSREWKKVVRPGPVWCCSLRSAALTGTVKFNTFVSSLFSARENVLQKSCACLHQDTFISKVTVEIESRQSVKMKMKAQWMSEDKLREQSRSNSATKC